MGLGIFAAVENQLQKTKAQLEGKDKKNAGINALEIAQLDELLAGVRGITSRLQKVADGEFSQTISWELKVSVKGFSDFVNQKLTDMTSGDQAVNKIVYATLCAIKDPVNMMADEEHLAKLENKEGVINTFYDFSFVNNQFGAVEISSESRVSNEVNNGTNTVAEINSINNKAEVLDYGTDFSRAISDYKEGCEIYRNNLRSAMVKIAKDDRFPAETFTAKMNFLNELLADRIADPSQKLRPFDKVRNTYIVLNNFGKTGADKQRDPNGNDAPFGLDDNNILSYRFFNNALGFAFDKTFIEGLIGDKRLALPEDTKKLLKGLVKKLTPYQKGREIEKIIDKKTGKTELQEDTQDRRIIGCDDALREKFNKAAVLIQVMNSSYAMLKQEQSLTAPGKPFHEIYRKIHTFNNKIISSLKNEPGAPVPTGQDLREVLSGIGDCFRTLPAEQIFTKEGVQHIADSLIASLIEVSNVIPELKNETDAIHSIFGERAVQLRNDFVKKANTTPASTDENIQYIDKILSRSCHLYYDNFLSEKDYYMAFYNKMAADPAYNAHVMTKLEKELDDWVETENKGKENHPKFAVLVNKIESFRQSGSSAVEGMRPEEECRIPFYKMYMMAKFIQQEQAGKTMDAGQIAALQKRADALYESGNFAGLDNITAAKFSDAIKQNGGVQALVKEAEERKAGKEHVAPAQLNADRDALSMLNTFMDHVDPAAVSALTQSSRGLYKNSDDYEAVSTAIKKINDLKAIGIGPSQKEYQELLTACDKYKGTHPAPSSQTGKRRLGAVNQMIENLRPILTKPEAARPRQDEPESEPQKQKTVSQPEHHVLKLKMFGKLAEKFDNLPEDALPGGKNHPDNKWYLDVADGLRQVSAAIENQETISADQAKTAFRNLQTASKAMIGHGRGEVPKEMQPLYTALLAIQKPLNFYAEKLEGGESLTQTLADPGWMKGMFKRPAPVEEREDYKPGNFNTEGKSLKDVLDAYKAEKPAIRKTFDDYMKKISGDEADPDGMLQEKILLMQDYVDSHNDPNRTSFIEHVGSPYKAARRRFENKDMRGLENTWFTMSPQFFRFISENAIDFTVLSGNIDKMETLSADARNLLKQECKQLVMKQKNMGFSDELIERLGEYAERYQGVSLVLQGIHQAYDPEDLAKDPDFEKIVNNANALTQGIEAYMLGDEGSRIPVNNYTMDVSKEEEYIKEDGKDVIVAPKIPSDKEWKDLARQAADYLRGKSVIKENGYIDYKNEYASELLQKIVVAVPDLPKEVKSIADNQMNTDKLDYLQLVDQARFLDPQNRKINGINGTSGYFFEDKFDRAFQMNSIYIRMARDPAYNEKMLTEAATTLQQLAANANTPNAGKCDSKLFRHINKGTNEVILPLKQQYKDVYTMYLMGKQFQSERQKMAALNDPKTGGAGQIQNAINPDMKELMTAEEIDWSFISSMDRMIQNIQGTAFFKDQEKNGPVGMSKISRSPVLQQALLKDLHKPKLNYLKGIDGKVHDAMMQFSGSNSPSYQKMSEAYKNIFENNAFPGSAERSDYMKLYNACRDYAYAHDSKPATSTGKLREKIAMQLMCIVGRKLVKDGKGAEEDVAFAKEYQSDHAINMARSKQYRDEAVKYEKKQIEKILSQHSDKYRNGFKALPVDAQKKLTEHYGMLTIAQGFDNVLENVSGHEITGKFTDPKVQEKLKVCFGAMKANRTNNIESFNAKPEDKLNQIVPPKHDKGTVLLS